MALHGRMVAEKIKRQLVEKYFPARKKTFCEKMDGKFKHFLMTYFDNSSIHGLKHFTTRNAHPIEFIMWILMLMFALWGTISLSQRTWQRYQDSPTVVSMDRDMFAWNTTFPCATICPHTKLEPKKLENYVKNSKVEDKHALENFLLILATANYSNFETVPHYGMIESKDYMPLLLNLSYCFQTRITIGTLLPLFIEPTITELGLCYAVNSKIAFYNSPNYRANNRWDYVKENDSLSIHPLDGQVIAQMLNITSGYDIFIHGPMETPDISYKRYSANENSYLKIFLTASTIYTTPDAAKLTVPQRKCRFYKESNLAHSPVYSYNLCRIDCRIALSIELCGCVPHFYRSIEGEKVCNVSGLHCLAKHKQIFLKLIDPKTKKKVCECLQNCDDVNYVIDTMSLGPWFLGSTFQWALSSYPKLRFKRDIIFGFADLLVSVGGMAGLFLGCSILSFTEIVYFSSIRLFWYLHGGKSNKIKEETKQKEIITTFDTLC